MKTLTNEELEALLRVSIDAIEDAMCELEQPEILELTSMALDRKLYSAQQQLRKVLEDE